MPLTPDAVELAELVRTLLHEVREERRRLHVERHEIYQIVLQGGHLPTLIKLVDLFEQQADRMRGSLTPTH